MFYVVGMAASKITGRFTPRSFNTHFERSFHTQYFLVIYFFVIINLGIMVI